MPTLDWTREFCDGKTVKRGHHVRYCYDLCARGSSQELATVFLHEAIHVCQQHGFGEIDNECQTGQAEEACLGKSFSRQAAFCFPIP